MIAEKRFRRLEAPELLRDVYDGAQSPIGWPLTLPLRSSPPDPPYTPIGVSPVPALFLQQFRAMKQYSGLPIGRQDLRSSYLAAAFTCMLGGLSQTTWVPNGENDE